MEELGIPVKVSFAQNREDIFLEYLLRDVKNGFYVDVGANDPVADSVTKLFYDKGWNGINIEPINRLYKSLVVSRPRDLNLNIGAGARNEKTKIREYTEYHGLSTMDQDMQQSYVEKKTTDEQYSKYKDYEVDVKSLKNIFSENKVKHIHFMKVDVEGFEYDVLKGNDWTKYRPEIICIEANHIIKDWRPLLKSEGYQYVYNDGLNDYYVSKESKKRAQEFSYIQAILPTPIINYPVASTINSVVGNLRAEKNTLVFRNSQLSARIDGINHELVTANTELTKLKTIRGLIISTLKHINRAIVHRIYPNHLRKQLAPLPSDTKLPLSKEAPELMINISKYDEEYLTRVQYIKHPIRNAILIVYLSFQRFVKAIVLITYRLLNKIKRTVSKI